MIPPVRAPIAALALFSLSLAIAGCADDLPAVADPDGGTPEAETRYGLATLEDINPDPDVVEVELVADHEHRWDTGREVMHALAYNGSNPGPVLEAKLGDRIIIHFENRLLWATTIHWHGLRVPEAMDGTPRVQDPVPPGGRFDYEFVAADAGLYWYHPHHHEGAQIELGLYGPILVHAPGEPALALDQPLLLDDVLIGDDGEIAGYDPHDPDDPHDTFDEDGDGAPTDRFGNTLLVNGRRDFAVPVQAGSWALFRLVNAASARFMRVALEGHTMRVIGVDGGLIAEPYDTDSLRIGIGERYQVLVHMDGEPGRRYAFTNTREPEDPFAFDPLPEGPIEVAWVDYAEDRPVAGDAPVFPPGDLPDFAAAGAIDFTWVLETIIIDGVPVNAINGAVWPDVPVPTFARDGDYTFAVENQDSGSHPWHLHGNRFQVLEIDGEPGPRGWKDTVDMQPGRRVILRTRLDNPGRWMIHCHILRHIEEGMTAELIVE